MNQDTLPGTALMLGAAFDPLRPAAGLSVAAGLVGLDRVREVAELLNQFDGQPIARLADTIALAWTSGTPMAPVLAVLRTLEQNALMAVLGASAVARTNDGRMIPSVLESLAPACRAMAGLPTKAEVAAPMEKPAPQS